jgi:hypothetical protein
MELLSWTAGTGGVAGNQSESRPWSYYSKEAMWTQSSLLCSTRLGIDSIGGKCKDRIHPVMGLTEQGWKKPLGRAKSRSEFRSQRSSHVSASPAQLCPAVFPHSPQFIASTFLNVILPAAKHSIYPGTAVVRWHTTL